MSDLSKIKLNGTVYNFKDAVARTPYYGICSTAKGTAQKTVTISNIETLTDGLSIFVKFTATNTAENPTLKINNLDPVAIKRYGTTAASTSTASSWNAGAVVQLIYDGTNFIMENFNNTTYSAMTEAEMQTGTATTARNITAARLKQAIEYHAPVTSVNGDTGAVTIDEIQTTAGENNVEYDLIGTAPANTNSGLVPLYKPTLVTFAKTIDYGRLTLGSSDTPGVLRIYSSTTNASGYTDLKTGSSSTNTRTITFPDATGTVALTSDIPSVSSWALAANKPSYTFSELTSHPTSIGGYGITDAYTKTEIDGLVSGVLHYKGTKATVSALPSSGNTTGDTWHVTADGSEWAWDGSDWQELGTAVDLSGYVPTSRTVNGKALTSDISLTASDVSALPSSTTYVSSFNGESGAITYTAPVTSVNGQTGAVTLTTDKWNDVSLNKSYATTTAQTIYIPYNTATNGTSMSYMGATRIPTAHYIAKYDGYSYLYSTTPSANDNSTKVATTAYVDAAIPSVPSWALASSKPTYTASEVGALPETTTYVSSFNGSTGAITYTAPVTSVNGFTGAVTIAIPQPYNATTNPTGFLRITDLPIYDGTVV